MCVHGHKRYVVLCVLKFYVYEKGLKVINYREKIQMAINYKIHYVIHQKSNTN